MKQETFGTTDTGERVERVTLSAHGLTVSVINWGAVIQDLRLEGYSKPVVLGFATFDPYPEYSPYFGATVGRVINRLRNGQFQVQGKVYQGDRNLGGKHMLHGGTLSIAKRVWHISNADETSIKMEIRDPDGWMGFPGNCDIACTYRVMPKGILAIELEARTDAPTVVNLGNHTYFNLDDSDTILDHQVQIYADDFLPLDNDLVPTGEVASVAGTPYDFRKLRTVRDMVDGEQRIFDLNYCLSRSRQDLRSISKVFSQKSGVQLDVQSTEPGVQFYAGNNMVASLPGLTGKLEGPYRGLCLEAQGWPDAPNQPNFHTIELLPGDVYRQETRYAFSIKEL